MKQIKILVTLFVLGIFGAFGARSAFAFTNQVQIQKLPSYVNANNFKLSCSAITEALVDGNPATTTVAQFFITKSGGSETAFGPAIDLTSNPCQVEVTNLQITEEKSYVFTVKLDSGETSSTPTIFDNSGPSPVSGYYKDGLDNGFRLHYHTPSDADFDKVMIYRGETPDFAADSAHEIATVNSSPNTDMTYEDYSGTNKYYAIRALDHAGNTSSLVGDGGGTTVTQTVVSPVAGSEKVSILPKEAPQGVVLGTEATPSPTSKASLVDKINQYAGGTKEPFKWILTHKKISLVVAVVLLGAAFFLFKRSSKK